MKHAVKLLRRLRSAFQTRAPEHFPTAFGQLFWVFCFVATIGTLRAENRQDDAVFSGPPCDYGAGLAPTGSHAGDVLRILHVEERTGVARNGDLVRAPLFFAEKECTSLNDLAIFAADDVSRTAEISFQADDVRNGPDGGISRVHLWFPAELKSGEKRQFLLVRRPATAAVSRASMALMTLEETPQELRIVTENGAGIFTPDGELLALPTKQGTKSWTFSHPGAFPSALITFPAVDQKQAGEVVLNRSTPRREVTWATGPLFAKIRVRLPATDGISLEQEYRIPKHGGELVITSAIFLGDRLGARVKENNLLLGEINAPDSGDIRVEKIPAGIRYALRAEHAYSVGALRSSADAGNLLAIPLVLGGPNGVWALNNKNFKLQGQRGQRGNEGEKETMAAWWTEVRLVWSEANEPRGLWESYREHVQPLVAIVEEPGATVEQLHERLRAVVREMKPIGWRQEAGRAWVLGDQERVVKILKGGPSPKEQDRENLLRGARASRAKLTNNGQRKLRDDEKGRAYGGLDPYHITYTQSAAAALAVLSDAPPSVSAVNYMMASAVREEGGRVDSAGNPYIDCFNRTLNMQLGPVLFGLTAGSSTKDVGLVRFYRDLATAPPVQAVFGRGQRPYTGAPAKSPDQTDYLYQAICDFWLRASELLANEDLSLHPLAFSRYTDCIDVMADRYHGLAAKKTPGLEGKARANFFRGQAHTHRWLGWSCAPFIRLLEEPSEKGAVGLTEAIHYTESLKGRWKNWPDLTYYILADLLVREALPRYERPARPSSPQNVTVQHSAGNAELTWNAVQGATEYRIYRSESDGGPYRWLNSPYLESPAPSLTAVSYRDAESKEDVSYIVTAVDAHGRESAWPSEPDMQ